MSQGMHILYHTDGYSEVFSTDIHNEKILLPD